MITLDSQHPPLGIWFIALDDKTDFMGCLNPVVDQPTTFHFDFRFRYHKDDKVFDSEDEKNWYHVEAQDSTPDEAIHRIREVVLRMAEIKSHDGPGPLHVDELLYRDYVNWDEFMQALYNKPHYYAKMATEELLKGE